MGAFKEFLKKTPAYSQMFWLFYVAEKLSRPFRQKGFAEFREDFQVQELLGGVKTFVDIGANDGYHSSNSFYWALRGARGACFEPVAATFLRLKRLYLFNSRVACRNVGISDRTGESVMVSLRDQSYIPETQDPNHREMHKAIHSQAKETCRVELQRFEDAVQGIALPHEIDLLTIDVEGHELSVLRSIPFDTYSFRAIIVETHAHNLDGGCVWTHRDLQAIYDLLSAQNYSPVRTTRGNTIFLGAGVSRSSMSAGAALDSVRADARDYSEPLVPQGAGLASRDLPRGERP